MASTGLMIPKALTDLLSLLPLHVWASLGAIVVLILAWLRARHAGAPYVPPPEFPVIAGEITFELRRVANAVERLASAQKPAPASSERHVGNSVVPSMFGR